MNKKDNKTWIAEAIAKHGDKYDYSDSVYVGAREKVWIYFNEHVISTTLWIEFIDPDTSKEHIFTPYDAYEFTDVITPYALSIDDINAFLDANVSIIDDLSYIRYSDVD